MRRLAACSSNKPVIKSRLLAACSFCLLTYSASAFAQSVPETVRINVEPAEPGIRSITVDKKYRPIISRDDKGVVIDTMGSDNTLPGCDVKLEVTLENSRVLHRDADLCSGNTLVVDVTSDGKPGATARVVGTSSGVAAGPVANAPAAAGQSQTQTSSAEPAGQGTETSIVEVTPPADTGGLPPLEQIETPISSGDPNSDTVASTSPGDFETTIRDSLSGGANAQAVVVTPNEARQWAADPGGQPGSPSVIEHTVPQTDDRDFRADCTTQAGFAKITFQQAPAGLQEGMPQAIRISAGDYLGSFNAFGSSSANSQGVSLPEVNIEMTDPLWEAMIKQSELSISIEGLPAYQVSLKGSANPVRLFVATCALPQQIVADGGQDPGADLSCNELGRVRSVEAVRPGQIVFRNSGRDAIEVSWVDYRGGERPYARLEPGQVLEQQTYVSHAWTVRGATGECRGIYVTQAPYREVVIGGQAGFGGNGAGGFGNNGAGGFGTQDGFQNDPFVDNGGGPVPPGTIGGGNQGDFQQQAARTNVADYLCTAGIDLNVVFSPDGQSATVAEMGYGAVTLQRLGSPNTFHYEGQGHTLKGQLQNATWSRPGLRDVFCARR